MHYEFEHDIDTVFNLLTDPNFLVDRCLALGELEASCEVEEEGDVTVINLRRKLKRDLPRFLAKIFDPVQTVQMTERWQSDDEGGWSGQYSFDVEGQPVSISADFELYSTDAGCCYTIERRVKAQIPLLGGRIEKFIHAQGEEGCVAELDYLQEQLA